MRNLKSWFLMGLMASSISYGADNYFWGNVRFDGGGFVSAVIPSPQQKDLVYVRTDVGGIYKWNASSQRWSPLLDWLSEKDVGLFGIEALALDPQKPERIYLLAGTDYFSDHKTAILISNDYGDTWDTTVVTDKFKAHGNGMGRQSGEKLAVDPNNSNVIYCGSRLSGLFRSADAGKTWQQASTIGQGAGSIVNDNGISFVLFDPKSSVTNGVSSTLFVGVASSTNNFYMSTDGGANFTSITGGPSQMPMRAIWSGNSLYITFSTGPGPHSVSGGSVYKYTPSTKVWTNVTPKDGATYYGSGGQSFAHGFGGLSVDPNDTLHMVLTTVNHYGANQISASNPNIGGWGDQIFTTTDGGITWNKVFSGNSVVDANGSKWVEGHAIHWAGSIAFDPFDSKKVWVVSGNGVFRTDDITKSAQTWKFQSKGIEETVPLDAVSIAGGPLVTAIGDYDGARYNDITQSTPLHSPNIGTTHSLGYAPLTGDFLRAGQVTDYSTGQGITSLVMYISKDEAKTWKSIKNVQGLHGMLAMNADGSALFHKPENTVDYFRSEDDGITWAKVTGLTSQSQYAPIVADQVNPQRLYLLDNMGDFFASSDAGATFAKVGSVVNNATNEYSASNMKIKTVPGKEGELWVPLDQAQPWVTSGYSQNGLAYSKDGGLTFTRFPAVNTCISIGFGKAKVEGDYFTLYLWGSANNGPIGLYRSNDKGASWERINDDKHQFGGPGNGGLVLGDMNVYGRVYMSGAGRGLIYGNIGGAAIGDPTPLSKNSASNNLFEMHENFIYLHNDRYPELNLDIIDAKGALLRSHKIQKGTARFQLNNLPKTALYFRLSQGNTLVESFKITH